MAAESLSALRITSQPSPSGTLVVNLVGEDEWWQVFRNGEARRLLPLSPEPTECRYWWVLQSLNIDKRTNHLLPGEVLLWRHSYHQAHRIALDFSNLGVTCQIVGKQRDFATGEVLPYEGNGSNE